jgi:hypothetical protein
MRLGNLYIIYYLLSMINHDYLLRLIPLYESLYTSELIVSYLIDCMS